MDKPKATAKDFFLWFGAMVALYLSVFAFITLIFDYLNYAFPDALPYYADPYSSSVSYEMASLLVIYPVFLILMRVIRGDIARDASRGDVWVRRWALVLTLFLAGATLVGDLVTLLMYFFNGDVTLRFALKVLIVFLVAGGIFLHFMADLRGYYERNPAKTLLLTWATGILVLVTIIAGFFIIGTPWQARLYRFDDQKVSDLQGLQYQIVNYWQMKEELPATLAQLNDSLYGAHVPVDPQSGESYEYRRVGPLAFELCATFNAPASSRGAAHMSMAPYPIDRTAETWQHDAGRTCYARTIDPERYPPFKSAR